MVQRTIQKAMESKRKRFTCGLVAPGAISVSPNCVCASAFDGGGGSNGQSTKTKTRTTATAKHARVGGKVVQWDGNVDAFMANRKKFSIRFESDAAVANIIHLCRVASSLLPNCGKCGARTQSVWTLDAPQFTIRSHLHGREGQRLIHVGRHHLHRASE